MPRLLADLHLHSVLSPCGDLDMSPQKIAQRARACGLDLIAVTDHNSAENARAVMKAGEREGIVVLPGLEVTTKEEVHILCLFDRPNDAESLQNLLYGRLGNQLNDPEYFGFQVICDDQDEILGFQPKLLIQAADVSLGELVAQVKALGGMAIAAHIDRPAFGLISQLGFIPQGLELSALEVSSATPINAIRQAMPQLDDYPIIRSSDAHFLDDIGRGYVELNVFEPDIEGIEQALWSLWQSNHERTFPSHSRYR
ncbi:MAG: PHP domain-containing protein [Bacteroidota bacterium]